MNDLASSTPAPRRVLVMEDELRLLQLFTRTLTEAGFEVHPAETLDEARDLLAQHHFDLFLCDIHMGEERATALLAEQAAELLAQGTQIVIMSAEGRYRELCSEMGIDFYLEKPILPDVLLTLLERLMPDASVPPAIPPSD